MQQILGHRSILTTARYTHLTRQAEQNTHQLIDQFMQGFSIGWGGVR